MTVMKLATAAFIISLIATYSWRLAAPESQPARTDPSTAVAPKLAPAEDPHPGNGDPAHSLATALAAKPGSAERKTIVALAARMQEQDVWGLCEILSRAEPGFERDTALLAALEVASLSDPFRAWELFIKARFHLKPALDYDLRREMVRADPKRAWDVITQGGRILDMHLVRSAADVWAKMRPFEAAEFGRRIADPAARKEFLSTAITRWLEYGEFEHFHRWIRQQPDADTLGSWINPYIFGGYALDDGPPAIIFEKLDFLCGVNLQRFGSEHPMGHVLRNAFHEPELRMHAEAWIARQTNPELRDAAWSALAEALAANEPEASSEALGRIVSPKVREGALISIAGQAMWQNPEAGIQRARQIADPAKRDKNMATMLAQWARQDPHAALQAFHETAPQLRGDHLRGAAVGWAQGAGTTEVFSILSDHPDAQSAIKAARDLACDWADDRPAEAARWAASAPAGPLRDAAVSGMVGARGLSGEQRMALAQTASDAAIRSSSVSNAFETWLSRDAQAAAQWLRNARGLPANQSAHLSKLAARATNGADSSSFSSRSLYRHGRYVIVRF